MARSAILAIRIISDATQAAKGMQTVETRTQKFERGLKKANRAALLVAGAGVVLGKRLEAAGEAAGTSNARIDQVLSNMGYVGREHTRVTDRAIESAEKLARATGIDPNAIKQAQATLLTFESLAGTADQVGGAFDRATNLSADLAAAGFGSAESAAVMLGKALQDPVRGATALRRVGVTLTAQQEAQVKKFSEAGKAAKAQEIILKAVEKQVGGVAEATANASDKQAVASQLMQEELGQKLAPLFERVRNLGIRFAEAIADNQNKALALAGVIGGLAAAVIAVNAAFKVYRATLLVVAALKKSMVLVTAAQTAGQYALGTAWLAGRVSALAMATGMRVLNAAMRANPLGVIITAITVVAGLFVLAYKRSETFRKIVNGVAKFVAGYIKTVISVVTSLAGWFRDRLPGAANRAKSVAVTAFRLMTAGPRAVVAIVRTLVSWFSSRIPSAANRAKSVAVSAVRAMTWPIRTVISAVQSLIRWIGNIRFPSPPAWMSSAASGIGRLFGRGGAPRALAAAQSTGVAASAARGRGGPAAGGLMLSTGRAGSSGGNVIINVSGALDPVAVADQISELLRRRGIRMGQPVGAGA